MAEMTFYQSVSRVKTQDTCIEDLLDIFDDGSREPDTVLIREALLGAAFIRTLTAGYVPTSS